MLLLGTFCIVRLVEYHISVSTITVTWSCDHEQAGLSSELFTVISIVIVLLDFSSSFILATFMQNAYKVPLLTRQNVEVASFCRANKHIRWALIPPRVVITSRNATVATGDMESLILEGWSLRAFFTVVTLWMPYFGGRKMFVLSSPKTYSDRIHFTGLHKHMSGKIIRWMLWGFLNGNSKTIHWDNCKVVKKDLL